MIHSTNQSKENTRLDCSKYVVMLKTQVLTKAKPPEKGKNDTQGTKKEIEKLFQNQERGNTY